MGGKIHHVLVRDESFEYDDLLFNSLTQVASAITRHALVREDCPVVKRRCAIYTRKSTEEGLKQSYNSLDARRMDRSPR